MNQPDSSSPENPRSQPNSHHDPSRGLIGGRSENPPAQFDWYYADAHGETAGPVSREELRRLAADGTIDSATYVYPVGGTEWQPYATALLPPIPRPIVCQQPTSKKPKQNGTALLRMFSFFANRERKLPAILALFLFYPIGLVLLWRSHAFKRSGKTIVGCAFALFGLLFLAALASRKQPADLSTNADHQDAAQSDASEQKSQTERGTSDDANKIPASASLDSNTILNSPVTFEVTTEQAARSIIVKGSTNLPEGTAISVNLFGQVAGESSLQDPMVVVHSGRFETPPLKYDGEGSADIPFPAGDYKLSVYVFGNEQTPAIQAIIGANGEHLSGQFAEDFGDGKRLRLERIISVDGSEAQASLNQIQNKDKAFKSELRPLFEELMAFKDAPAFREIGFSYEVAGAWQDKIKALMERQPFSTTQKIMAGNLYDLGSDYFSITFKSPVNGTPEFSSESRQNASEDAKKKMQELRNYFNE